MSTRPATAPSLLKELLQYTPQGAAFSSSPEQRCNHAYVTSLSRSSLPGLDERPGRATVWSTSSVCLRCRCHLTLRVDFRDSQQPCPTHSHPLHSFRIDQEPRLLARCQSFVFLCGATGCKCRLTADIRAPVLSGTDVTLITHDEELRRRAQETSRQRGADVPPSTAVEALNVLRSYVRDAIKSEEVKRIPSANKRFMLALGGSARPLLERLGFVFEPARDEKSYEYWRLPNVGLNGAAHLLPELQDVEDELVVLLNQRPATEKGVLKEAPPETPPSQRDMERILGSLDYARCPPAQQQAAIGNRVLDSFRQLGAEADFADSLVAFAYDQNINWNPPQGPVLFQHLCAIAAFRQSELLEVKVLTLRSAGMVAQDKILAAYQYFDIHPDRENTYSDEQILGIYQSMAQDIGADEQIKAKQALQTISSARNSGFLRNAAANRFETYEEALGYLGADKSTPDDFIPSLVAAKSSEAPPSHDLALKALAVIAEARNSDLLRYHAHGDAAAKPALDPAQAYALLGIHEPDSFDDDMVGAYHGVAVSDFRDRAQEFHDALGVIAEIRNSIPLRNLLADSQTQTNAPVQQSPLAHMDPRGLNNIGNTCYLNSLLQYLYTIKPLRELLKNFDDHRQNLDAGAPFVKQVAGMKASEEDVKKAQDFANELGKLFVHLESTNERAVSPDVNLARLTIGEPKSPSYDLKTSSPVTTRRLTISSPEPKAALPELREPLKSEAAEDLPDADKKASVQHETGGDSDATMVDSNVIKPDPDAPTPAPSAEATAEPDAMDIDSTADKGQNKKGLTISTDVPMGPEPAKSLKQQTEEWANQQDVTDALENVIKQLQWAIKPEELNKSGDQVDLISRLFWGIEHVMYVKPEGEFPQVLDFKDLLVRPDDNPTDLTEALDDIEFGKEDHGPNFYKYNVIVRLPPILHIAISRAKSENGTYVRNANQLVLHKEIYMDRYVNNQEMVRRRKQAFQLKDSLRQLKSSCGLLQNTDLSVSASDALKGVAEHLQALSTEAADLGLDVQATESSVSETLLAESSYADESIAKLEEQMRPLEQSLAELSTPGGVEKYCLQAVFIHVGSSLVSGHWFIYNYDHRTDTWRRYNDETVEKIDAGDVERTILKPEEGTRGASAYVSYVRESERDAIFDTVSRQPAEQMSEISLQQGSDVEAMTVNGPPEPQVVEEERPDWDKERPGNDGATQW